MLPEFVERLKNVEALHNEKSWAEASRAQHELISKFLSHGDEVVEPISQMLFDPSSSSSTTELILRMIEVSGDERFISPLIQFLLKSEDDDLREIASDMIFDYGDLAAPYLIKALEEKFGRKEYDERLIETLNGKKAAEFIEKILEDFLSNRDHYDGWFDMGHFAWGLAEIEEKETSLSLVERLLQLKDLRRIDKLMLEHVRKFLEDEENCKKALEREEEEKEHSIVKLVLTGVLNSSFRELVPDGPRPVINDDSVREYLPLMYSIEHPIFSWYKEHPSLKDSDVIELLKNIRDGIWKDYEGKNEFEKSFIAGLKLSVFELNLRYTKGEVSACISRVLNSVKRHRESEGERGYLEFIKNFFMKEGPV